MNETTDKIISIQRIPSPTFESIDFVPPVYSDTEISPGEINGVNGVKDSQGEIKGLPSEIKSSQGEPKIDQKKRIIKKKKNKELKENNIYDEFIVKEQTEVTNSIDIEQVNQFELIEQVNKINEAHAIQENTGRTVQSNSRVNKYRKRCN